MRCVNGLGLMLFVSLIVSCGKEPSPIPFAPLPTVDVAALFTDSFDIETVLPSFTKIHQFLKDTLTEKKEITILDLLRSARQDSSLNSLIIKLHASGLLANLVIRWDEEIRGFQEPGMFDSERIKPENEYMQNHLFELVFCYPNLSMEPGRNVLSAFKNALPSTKGNFNGPKDTTSGLQSLMLGVVNTRVREPGNRLSPDGRILALEVFEIPQGSSAFQTLVKNAFERLSKK